MSTRGRTFLLVGLLVILGALVGGTSRVNRHSVDCGTALNAQTPPSYERSNNFERSECHDAVQYRRTILVIVGLVGAGLAIYGVGDTDEYRALIGEERRGARSLRD